jgi:hypothetical protein
MSAPHPSFERSFVKARFVFALYANENMVSFPETVN